MCKDERLVDSTIWMCVAYTFLSGIFFLYSLILSLMCYSMQSIYARAAAVFTMATAFYTDWTDTVIGSIDNMIDWVLGTHECKMQFLRCLIIFLFVDTNNLFGFRWEYFIISCQDIRTRNATRNLANWIQFYELLFILKFIFLLLVIMKHSNLWR